MPSILEFFSYPFFTIIGGILSIIAIGGLIFAIYLSFRGFFPVWYKLGTSLSNRKIAIFSDSKFNELKSTLIDSGIFKEKNIIKIDKESIKKGEDITFFIVHYLSYKDNIEEIINLKNDSDAMIIYAPQSEGFIDESVVNILNLQRNTIIVNLRGRLLNDTLVSMMTTSFKK